MADPWLWSYFAFVLKAIALSFAITFIGFVIYSAFRSKREGSDDLPPLYHRWDGEKFVPFDPNA